MNRIFASCVVRVVIVICTTVLVAIMPCSYAGPTALAGAVLFFLEVMFSGLDKDDDEEEDLP